MGTVGKLRVILYEFLIVLNRFPSVRFSCLGWFLGRYGRSCRIGEFFARNVCEVCRLLGLRLALLCLPPLSPAHCPPPPCSWQMHTQSADDIYAVGMLLTELAFGKETYAELRAKADKLEYKIQQCVQSFGEERVGG